MNYQKHYDALIDRARSRVLSGIYERHHIVPRSIGGLDVPENIVRLTLEEHFLAHELLVKIFPQNRNLATALALMSKRCNNNKIFGWIRRRHILSKLGNTNWLGKTHGDQAKAKLSKANKGKKLSEEHKRKLSIAHTGKSLSADHRSKISQSVKIALGAPGMWEKLSKSSLGKTRTSETRLKISKAMLGNKRWLGKKHSPGTKEKLRILAIARYAA